MVTLNIKAGKCLCTYGINKQFVIKINLKFEGYIFERC